MQHLLRWEDEGAVVERWIKNCLGSKNGREPSRLALGRYLKERWSRELERRNALKQSKPAFVSKWKPPGPGLLDENKFRCSEGPIGFALDVISQW